MYTQNIDHVGSVKIADQGLRMLSRCWTVTLRRVVMYRCEIGEYGVRQLNRVYWPMLETLNLRNQKVNLR